MPTVDVKIEGASQEAKLMWDGGSEALTESDGAYTASFDAESGKHVYAVVVFGGPGEKWTAKVSSGKKKRNHAGHMSPAGFDTTGDTPFDVPEED